MSAAYLLDDQDVNCIKIVEITVITFKSKYLLRSCSYSSSRCGSHEETVLRRCAKSHLEKNMAVNTKY